MKWNNMHFQCFHIIKMTLQFYRCQEAQPDVEFKSSADSLI